MYRQLLQHNHLQIYCIRGDWCDFDCGRFHRRKLQNNGTNSEVSANVDAIEKAALLNHGNRQNEPPKLTVVATSLPLQGTINPSADRALSLALPASPFPYSNTPSPAGSLATRQNGPLSVSVTLDDIIASARRKISEDYTDIQLPSPVFMDEQDKTGWDKRAGKKLLFHYSSLDVPAMESMDVPTESFLAHKYEDVDSEAELAIQEEPPRFMNDEEAEDLEEMIKAAQPPTDAFSNPIMLRDSDSLTTRKKTKRGGKHHAAATVLRQQSKSRLLKLGEMLDSRTSSVNCTNDDFDDGADNSSIADGTESLAELSAMVAKSTAHSGATSPSNILQFIEEQKHRVANTGAEVEAVAEEQL
uniref:Uncharacterized protein n=1 Tax=Globodera rostochiensis TaxID=31243 RepID=A0A914HNB8_GLORO